MFNYSEEVIYYLKESERIASSLNSKYVEVVHLVLSLLTSSNNVNDILKQYGITYKNFLKNIKKNKDKTDILFYKDSVKRILVSSLESLKEFKSNIITEEILFLNILEENDFQLVKIFDKYNIDIRVLYGLVKEKIIPCENSLLLKIGDNLNEKSEYLDKVYGREKEIKKIIEVLARKKKNNPLLIGNSGVGKTAIVEELARLIKNKNVPLFLKDYEIISIPISTVVSGSKYRGEFEEKLESIIKECERSKKYILFIDEVHTIVGAGGAEGAIDASNILKPSLARGNIKVIGATTKEEYEKFIKNEKALERRFNIIEVNEPNKNETKEILMQVKKEYENFHKVKISEYIIDSIISNSKICLPDRYEPDRSIDLLDRVCAYVSVNKNKVIDNLVNIIEEKNKSLKNKEYEKAIDFKKKEKSLRNHTRYKEVTLNDLNSVIKSNIFAKSKNKIGFYEQKNVKKHDLDHKLLT